MSRGPGRDESSGLGPAMRKAAPYLGLGWSFVAPMILCLIAGVVPFHLDRVAQQRRMTRQPFYFHTIGGEPNVGVSQRRSWEFVHFAQPNL